MLVEAEDTNQGATSAYVNITIEDVNDEPPHISLPPPVSASLSNRMLVSMHIVNAFIGHGFCHATSILRIMKMWQKEMANVINHIFPFFLNVVFHSRFYRGKHPL